MRAAAIMAALLLTGAAGAQTSSVPTDLSLVEPQAPPGSPPAIRSGTVSRISAGEGALRQIAVLGGSKVDVEVRGKGLVGAILYDPDGNPLSMEDGPDIARLNLVTPRDGIYFLAPLGPAGATLDVTLTIAPPLPPRSAEPAWKARVTDLVVEETAYGDAFAIPANEIMAGDFAQAAMTPFDTERPAILYRFEGRLAQRVKITVRSPDAHSLVKILRTPDDPKPLRSSDAQYRGDVGFDSVLDRYLPADGSYFILVQAYASGPKGERDPHDPPPDRGSFTIQLSLK